jgi:hypothetical protein
VSERDDVRVDIVRFDEWRFHYTYVLEDESMCVCGEQEYLHVESGVGEDRDRSLSFIHSFDHSLEIRIKQKERTPKNQHQYLTTITRPPTSQTAADASPSQTSPPSHPDVYYIHVDDAMASKIR